MSRFRDLLITIATSADSSPYSNGIWLLQDGEVVPGYEGIYEITGWFDLEVGQDIYVGAGGSTQNIYFPHDREAQQCTVYVTGGYVEAVYDSGGYAGDVVLSGGTIGYIFANYCNLTVTGGLLGHVNISSSVDISGGTIDSIYVEGYADIIMSGGLIRSIYSSDWGGIVVEMSGGSFDDLYLGTGLASWGSLNMTGGTIDFIVLGCESVFEEMGSGGASVAGYVKQAVVTAGSCVTVLDGGVVDHASVYGFECTDSWSGELEHPEIYISKLVVKSGGRVKKLTQGNAYVEITVEDGGIIEEGY